MFVWGGGKWVGVVNECVVHVCVMCVHECAQVCLFMYMCRGQGFTLVSNPLDLIPLRQNLSLSLELDWQPVGSKNAPVSVFHSAGVMDTQSYAAFYTGFWELNSYMCIKCFHPLIRLPRTQNPIAKVSCTLCLGDKV